MDAGWHNCAPPPCLTLLDSDSVGWDKAVGTLLGRMDFSNSREELNNIQRFGNNLTAFEIVWIHVNCYCLTCIVTSESTKMAVLIIISDQRQSKIFFFKKMDLIFSKHIRLRKRPIGEEQNLWIIAGSICSSPTIQIACSAGDRDMKQNSQWPWYSVCTVVAKQWS